MATTNDINPLDYITDASQWLVTNNTSGSYTITTGGTTATSTGGGYYALNPNAMNVTISPNSWTNVTTSWDEAPVQEAVPSDPWEAAIHKASQMMKNG